MCASLNIILHIFTELAEHVRCIGRSDPLMRQISFGKPCTIIQPTDHHFIIADCDVKCNARIQECMKVCIMVC